MVSMALPSQVCTRESIERKPWTSEARNDVFGFLAQSVALVAAAIFLYSLGPGLGMTLIAVGLVVWSLLGSQIASEEEEDGHAEDSWHAAALNSPAHCASPAWVRSERFGTSNRPVERQGA